MPKKKKHIVAEYNRKASSRQTIRTAAQQWANGVPWKDALKIAQDVSRKVSQHRRHNNLGQ